MPKTLVKVFASFADLDADLAMPFLELLTRQLAPSARYAFDVWHFHMLLAGVPWDPTIQSKLAASDVGIVLVSPALLNSRYVALHELPALLAKPVIPVMLRPVDFSRHDLRGLQHLQVFRHRGRAYGELPTRQQREAFVAALHEGIELRLGTLSPIGAVTP